MVVPSGHPASDTSIMRPPSICSFSPESRPFWRVVIVTRATAAMDGSASPRKPSVSMSLRLSPDAIFDVAWFSNAMRASSGAMPQPLSVTRR